MLGLFLAACSGGSSSGGGTPPATPTPTLQTRFLRASERDVRTLEGLPDVRHVTLADLDGDGHVDVVAGRASGVATIAWGELQSGQPETTSLQLDATGEWTAAADVDLDGDLDLILPAGPAQLLAIWIQVAPRVFEPGAALLPGGELLSAVVVADLDGDGIADLAGARLGQNLLLRGDGVGSFSVVSDQLPFDTRTSTSVAVGNLLGDSRPDLVFGGMDSLAILRNDGGAYTDVTVVATGQEWQALDVQVADVDADGNEDLLVRLPYDVAWLRGDGAGALTVAQTIDVLSGTPNTRLADDDRDGDLDLVVSGGGAIKLFRFDRASTSFLPTPAGTIPGGLSYLTRVLAWSDLDGDDAPEMVLGSALRILWSAGVAGSYFEHARLSLPGYHSQTAGHSAVVAGDFDADGDVDLHIGSTGTGGSFGRLHRNDGAARFAGESVVAAIPWAMADVNADGWPDLLSQQWYAGDGTGNFAPGQAWPVSGRSGLGDFDGDGIQEVLKISDGMATLLEPAPGGPVPGVSTPVASTSSITVADINQDGIDDFVAVRGSTQTGMFFGTTSGVFEDRTSSLPTDLDSTAAVAAGDWDGDGDIDLIVARFLAGPSNEYARIYRNDGASQFTIGESLFSTEPAPLSLDGIAAADVDEDGRVEVFVQLQ